MYIEQFCLAVLFFLKITDGVVFLAEGVLMLFLMAVTLSAQVLYQRSFDRRLNSYFMLRVNSTLPYSYNPISANVVSDSETAGTVGAPQGESQRA